MNDDSSPTVFKDADMPVEALDEEFVAVDGIPLLPVTSPTKKKKLLLKTAAKRLLDLSVTMGDEAMEKFKLLKVAYGREYSSRDKLRRLIDFSRAIIK